MDCKWFFYFQICLRNKNGEVLKNSPNQEGYQTALVQNRGLTDEHFSSDPFMNGQCNNSSGQRGGELRMEPERNGCVFQDIRPYARVQNENERYSAQENKPGASREASERDFQRKMSFDPSHIVGKYSRLSKRRQSELIRARANSLNCFLPNGRVLNASRVDPEERVLEESIQQDSIESNPDDLAPITSYKRRYYILFVFSCLSWYIVSIQTFCLNIV